MQQCCTSGSVEGVVGDHDSYSDRSKPVGQFKPIECSRLEDVPIVSVVPAVSKV
jgi:hypothetical protein